MQKKIEFFDRLPSGVKEQATKNLSALDLVSLTKISKKSYSLFQPQLAVPKLLRHVVCGEHDEVVKMLTQDINLLFKRGQVTDCSGRIFAQISAFEYALWAWDEPMWAMMLQRIPKDAQGEKIRTLLGSQFNKVDTLGITYRHDGVTITEKNFNFNTLIKELATQIHLLTASGKREWSSIDKQWIEGVGGAQKLLPMHVVAEYCSNESFDQVPQFSLQPNPSKHFRHWLNNKAELWFDADSKLAIDFALHKGDRKSAYTDARIATWGFLDDIAAARRLKEVTKDLAVMVALRDTRNEGFSNLKLQFEESLLLEPQFGR